MIERLPPPAPCPSPEDMWALFQLVEKACERHERSDRETIPPPRRNK